MNVLRKLFSVIAICCCTLTVIGASSAETPTVGMEGQVEVTVGGAVIEGLPVTERSKVIVRVAESRPHGTLTYYDLRYVGLEPGKFDLRDFLRRKDGTPVSDLPELPVTIAGVLPKEHQGELVATTETPVGRLGGYKLLIIGIGVLWVLLIIPLFVVGRRRKNVVQTAVPVSAPTLADRLRPLVKQALEGSLTRDDQARIERMLLNYWRDRLNLNDIEMPEALKQLRTHAEAGALLRELENWLHRPPGTVKVDINKLLLPYQNISSESSKAVEVAR